MTAIATHGNAGPTSRPVPDFHSKGRFEQLLNEMDLNGVDQAFLVCAGIEHNPCNNDYIARMSRLYPGRIRQVADVDCSWSETYHTPGAAQRLHHAAERWSLSAFTHYMKAEDDGSWLYGEDGLAFFTTAAEMGLIASIACSPHHHTALHRVAEQFPQLPILIHHLGHPGVGERERMEKVLASARFANIGVKVSRVLLFDTAGILGFPLCRLDTGIRSAAIRKLRSPAAVLGLRLSGLLAKYDLSSGHRVLSAATVIS